MSENTKQTSTKDPSGKPGVDLRNLKTAKKQDDKSAKFKIPEDIKKKYPELVTLILGTESMNDDERQYWFQIMPIMTEEQTKKLHSILQNEKEQLAKLDEQYEEELKKLNDKHLLELKEKEFKKERTERFQKEKAAEEEEKDLEEELLKKLDETEK